MEISLRVLSAISFEKVKTMRIQFRYFVLIRSEQQTIDVERELRYDFMCERTGKEMPTERKLS